MARNRWQTGRPHAGMTLIELLIVITILGMITAAAIPMMYSGVERAACAKPAAGQHVHRHGPLARHRDGPAGRNHVRQRPAGPRQRRWQHHVDNGRSAGRLCRRHFGLGGPALVPIDRHVQLWPGAVPSRLRQHRPAAGRRRHPFWLSGPDLRPAGTNDATGATSDVLRNAFGHRPAAAVGGRLQSLGDRQLGATPPFPTASSPPLVPYQVYRQPLKSAEPPLQLPEGTVVDLGWSGTGPIGNATTPGTTGFFVASVSPSPLQTVVITFDAQGKLDSLYLNGILQGHAGQTVCFLVGRPEQMIGIASASQWSDDYEPERRERTVGGHQSARQRRGGREQS